MKHGRRAMSCQRSVVSGCCVLIGRLHCLDITWLLGFLVSWFLGLASSRLLGFLVSCFLGLASSRLLGFLVSCLRGCVASWASWFLVFAGACAWGNHAWDVSMTQSVETSAILTLCCKRACGFNGRFRCFRIDRLRSLMFNQISEVSWLLVFFIWRLHGCLASWFLGFLVAWLCGVLASWFFIFTAAWLPGGLASWLLVY